MAAIAAAILLLNSAILITRSQGATNRDPIISAILSVVLPVSLLGGSSNSTKDDEENKPDQRRLKVTQRWISLIGTVLLLLSLWIVAELLPKLSYNPAVIVPRQIFKTLIFTTTGLGLLALTASFFLSSFRVEDRDVKLKQVISVVKERWNKVMGTFLPNKKKDKAKTEVLPGDNIKGKVIKLVPRMTLILICILMAVLPFLMPAQEKHFELRLWICDKPVERSFWAYSTGIDKNVEARVETCDKAKQMGEST